MLLKTERLILRPWEESDAEQLVNGIRFTPMEKRKAAVK